MITIRDLERTYLDLVRNPYEPKMPLLNSSTDGRDAIESLQRTLLEQTMKYAYRNCPFYKTRWSRIPNQVRGTLGRVLIRLPVVHRNHLSSHHSDFLSRVARPVMSVKTSGTTGNPLSILLTKNELRARMYLGLIEAAVFAHGDPVDHQGFIANHGSHASFAIGRPGMLSVGVLVDPRIKASAEQFVDILLESGSSELPLRMSTIGIGGPQSRFLIRQLFHSQIDLKSVGVRSVLLGGRYFSRYFQRSFQRHFAVDTSNVYSLAEMCGDATQCSPEGWYHFGLSMIPETVDPRSLQPVEFDHEGLLLLTSLHPFQEAVPLIRYSTGDLVTLSDRKCPNCSFLGVSMKEFRGRLNQGVDVSDLLPPNSKRKFVSVIDVYEALEVFPQLAFTDDSTPKFFLSRSDDPNISVLSIQVEFDTIPTERLRKAVTRKVSARIYRALPNLRKSKKVRVRVELLGPGKLRRTHGKI